MVFIYVLELVGGKYYVGKTNNPNMRVSNHFEMSGSAWTRKYKPERIFALIPDCDNFDEDKYTLKYMEKYGINNVRGGSFCEIILPKEQISVIAKMISSSTDKCFVCGQPGHFASTCPGDPKSKVPILPDDPACTCPGSYFSAHRKSKCVLNKITDTVWNFFPDENDMIESIIAEQILIAEPEPVKTNQITTQPIVQAQLQSQPQTTQQVITNTLIHPCQYCGKEFETKSGAVYHENFYCKTKPVSNNSSPKTKSSPSSPKKFCGICGRTGHVESECFANTTKLGQKIVDIYCCEYCGKEFDSLKGLTYHENVHCKAKLKSKPQANQQIQDACYRCGRSGHYASNCFATSHISGKYLGYEK